MPVTLLVGTTKGLFLISSDPQQDAWRVRGPVCDGWRINHALGAPETGRIWAVGGDDWTGAGVWSGSSDGAWELTQLAHGQRERFARTDPETAAALGVTPSPDAPYDGEIDALWSIAGTPERLLVGTKPAQLYESRDGGVTWTRNTALADHESRESWFPGAAGLTLHTILVLPGPPETLLLGISAAGVFASEDGGASWERRNRLSNAGAASERPHPAAGRDGEIGHCVHNMVQAGGVGDRVYMQNHHGVFASLDAGRSWEDITRGLPSTFGFPVASLPGAPETVFTLPLNGDSAGRYPPDAAAAVWRSEDGGKTWRDCRTGLPQVACHFTVLRQAMATDRAETPGLYFGTNTGSVFASHDAGESWDEIARHLPTVLSIETLTRPASV
ncbi:WD40/YVTN/BNR-like repeat-containing protein [Litorisediminicola beolgyonensis]|uniref:WD40/YVTN/BNR-like repeat-containing protein n=1 Tax=Litorisediminicola beolgyonensis TaxID=1173614 RepID=A0ABW3ZKE0_9RHOB